MSIDMVTACLVVVLGASVANALDEMLGFTPRIASWLGRLVDLG